MVDPLVSLPGDRITVELECCQEELVMVKMSPVSTFICREPEGCPGFGFLSTQGLPILGLLFVGVLETTLQGLSRGLLAPDAQYPAAEEEINKVW